MIKKEKMNYYKIKIWDLDKDYISEFDCTEKEMQRLVVNLNYKKFQIISMFSFQLDTIDINKFINKPEGLETGVNS